jgi:hypothetical protein
MATDAAREAYIRANTGSDDPKYKVPDEVKDYYGKEWDSLPEEHRKNWRSKNGFSGSGETVLSDIGGADAVKGTSSSAEDVAVGKITGEHVEQESGSVITAAGGAVKEGDRHIKPVGNPRRNLKIYIEHHAGPNPTEEQTSTLGAEWSKMTPSDKHTWQHNTGRASVEAAYGASIHTLSPMTDIQAEGRQGRGADKKKNREGDALREAAFATPEQKEAFKNQGTLFRQRKVESAFDDKDTVASDAVGNWSTQPEDDWKKTWKAGQVNSAKSEQGGYARALHTDPQYHQKMDSLITSLQSKTKAFGAGFDAPLSRTTNFEAWAGSTATPNEQYRFGEGQASHPPKHLLNDAGSIEAQAAHEALAKSAKAHTLGMKDAAVAHFTTAVHHVQRLASIRNGQAINSGMGGQMVPEEHLAASDTLTDYQRSVGDLPPASTAGSSTQRALADRRRYGRER